MPERPEDLWAFVASLDLAQQSRARALRFAHGLRRAPGCGELREHDALRLARLTGLDMATVWQRPLPAISAGSARRPSPSRPRGGGRRCRQAHRQPQEIARPSRRESSFGKAGCPDPETCRRVTAGSRADHVRLFSFAALVVLRSCARWTIPFSPRRTIADFTFRGIRPERAARKAARFRAFGFASLVQPARR